MKVRGGESYGKSCSMSIVWLISGEGEEFFQTSLLLLATHANALPYYPKEKIYEDDS